MCACVCIHVPWYVQRGQRTPSWSFFSSSTMWVLGIEVGLSALAAGTFTHYTITCSFPSLKPKSRGWEDSSVAVMVCLTNLSHLESPGKRTTVTDCLSWVDLWCVCGRLSPLPSLIREDPPHCVGRAVPWAGGPEPSRSRQAS